MTALEISTAAIEEAMGRVVKIRTAVEDVKLLIVEAYQARDWITLGHASWDEYCRAEFGGGIALPKSERGDLVFTLRNAGMSYPAIASATDMSTATAFRTASTFSNEKVEPDDDEVVDAEILDEPAPIVGVNGKTYRPTAAPRERVVAHDPPGVVLYEFLKMISNIVDQEGIVPFDALTDADRVEGAETLSRLLDRLAEILETIKGKDCP